MLLSLAWLMSGAVWINHSHWMISVPMVNCTGLQMIFLSEHSLTLLSVLWLLDTSKSVIDVEGRFWLMQLSIIVYSTNLTQINWIFFYFQDMKLRLATFFSSSLITCNQISVGFKFHYFADGIIAKFYLHLLSNFWHIFQWRLNWLKF